MRDIGTVFGRATDPRKPRPLGEVGHLGDGASTVQRKLVMLGDCCERQTLLSAGSAYPRFRRMAAGDHGSAATTHEGELELPKENDKRRMIATYARDFTASRF